MIFLFKTLFLREWRVAWRRAEDIGIALGFMLIATSLFPIAVGPEPQRLSLMASGVIWVIALIAVLMSLDRLFHQDHHDGVLMQLLLSNVPPSMIILTKAFTHWLSTGVPLIAITPLAGMFLNLPLNAYLPLLLSLLLATPSLSLIGTLGASLTVGARRSAILLTLLVLPLYIPVLIFAVTGVEAAMTSLNPAPHFLILGALLILSLVACPLGGGAAIKFHQEA
ncbi:MAG: heme exporter protein CcmB [Alphaproteobacteria bacterium]